MKLKTMVDAYVQESGTTHEALARAMGISKSSLYNKIRGDKELKLSEGVRLARIMGVSVDEIGQAACGIG